MSQGQGPHPSLYALDRAAAAGRLSDLGEHATSCSECLEHLRRIQERQAIPDRLASLPAGAPARPAFRRAWAWAGGAVAAASALAVLVVVTLRAPGPAYVGAKGGPSASLYVKRGDRVFPWAPPVRVQPGDLLRLAVVPDGFSHLTVATPGPGQEDWTVLFEGAVSPERELELPASWRVDAAGSEETLLVVFSRQPLRAEALPGLAVQRPRGEGVWTVVLEIDKIGGR